jgi:hypothetical protein
MLLQNAPYCLPASKACQVVFVTFFVVQYSTDIMRSHPGAGSGAAALSRRFRPLPNLGFQVAPFCSNGADKSGAWMSRKNQPELSRMAKRCGRLDRDERHVK